MISQPMGQGWPGLDRRVKGIPSIPRTWVSRALTMTLDARSILLVPVGLRKGSIMDMGAAL